MKRARLIVAPPWRQAEARNRRDRSGAPLLVVVIQPSMGFGTGHHATTRLCLNLMQRQSLMGARVLDVGTGSGVLAIAASTLGATDVVAIDSDPDALQSAAENIGLNGADGVVQPRLADLGVDGASLADSGRFDLVRRQPDGRGAGAVRGDPRGARSRRGGSRHRERLSQLRKPRAWNARSRRVGWSGRWREQADEWVALAFTSPSASTAR